ncbi:HD domain-containing protein [Streptomyces phaeolivaceus]|uniref:HD domain-containing protein n=1 Tax=Streptomyces phaeolivaceus TaxID=2653200 RepID=A0A5P8K3U5_9ACTN|nr:HD domain-containing protein [Streptomyces phaeolivaceus]QFQ97189.1 HD domain-containing protein [Streptomyces phaeolivaceus]
MPPTPLTLPEIETLARTAHATQTDKSGHPYTEHLQAVANGVGTRGGDEDQIAAAWLHDAIEDDALTEEWLRDAPLTPRTKAIVLALTKRPGEPPESYAARILSTPGALLVKQSDLAHNANPARLAALDTPTRTRLTHKYAHMRNLLGLPDEPTAEEAANNQN